MAVGAQFVASPTLVEQPAPPLRRAEIDGSQPSRRSNGNQHPPPEALKTASAIDPWDSPAGRGDGLRKGSCQIQNVHAAPTCQRHR